ncbi:hypothetical protein AMS68_004067 [Peltaster fructicola]|uniref:Uncharacterized protein n=1 Tax=Peltaster fructicola TaxID=286661 RepID=A0A6H0XVS7_9PEZI|nr:hypothetical protein AMS68_004067 [Peltaster fructicola]
MPLPHCSPTTCLAGRRSLWPHSQANKSKDKCRWREHARHHQKRSVTHTQRLRRQGPARSSRADTIAAICEQD